MKKNWEKPKLIVLIRGKPEESVLFFCKLFGDTNGALGFITGCGYFTDPDPDNPDEPPPYDRCKEFVAS